MNIDLCKYLCSLKYSSQTTILQLLLGSTSHKVHSAY